ncbi:S41 family peptidase [Butyrivibrio sp. JL13D10]|uniref:S41 family peptidase n=1 Tax=Butyrivibrio sp. JL13D10 TaxID=3236815 RepID=UPI0038B5DE01
MKKKIIALLLLVTLTLSACGAANSNASQTGSTAIASDEDASIGTASDEGDSDAATDTAVDAVKDTAKDAATDTGSSSADATTSEKGQADNEDFSDGDIKLLWDDSRVYLTPKLGSNSVLPTYSVKGYEDVPFVKATNYLDIIFERSAYSTLEDGVLKVHRNGTEAVIDPEADTIYFENTSRFRSIGIIEGSLLDFEELNVVSASVKNSSSQTESTPLTVSLSDYHMPVFLFEDDILMPFLALQNTFGAVTMRNWLAYNGKDYCNLYIANNYLVENSDTEIDESPFLRMAFKGPFSEKSEPSQDYANYSYYSNCLLLDLYYGHKDEKNITTFDEYFTRLNIKPSLCSTDISTVSFAECLVFFYLFDSGHDAFLPVRSVFGKVNLEDTSKAEEIIDDIKDSEAGSQLFEDEEETEDNDSTDALGDAVLGVLFEKGFKVPEIAPLSAWGIYLGKKKPADYGSERLDYVDDTAIIYFDAFIDNMDRNPSFYLEPITEDDFASSSFAFFYSCFEEIKTHKEVKNVVLNVSSNGGGYAAALVSILGFLSKDGEVTITDMDIISGSYREECYHVDTNLDGIADDNDGYGDQYDFFIMTSPSSYSCANALPYFAQQNGLAKIIGTKPGGGDCIVGGYLDAYGYGGSFSGMLKLGKLENGEFVSNEKVTEPDLNMMPSLLDFNSVPWFDPEGITDAVHQCKEGKTEMTYSAEDKLDAFAEALTILLNVDDEEDSETETEE